MYTKLFRNALFGLSLLFAGLSVAEDGNDVIHPICRIQEPGGWLRMQAPETPPDMEILSMYVMDQNTGLRPNMNILTTPTDFSLQEFVREAREDWEALPGKVWQDLGLVKTNSGTAHLSQIDMETQWGDVRTIQAILVKKNHAVILTVQALREEFGEVQDLFFKTVRSLEVEL